jgi:hypothetical protein
MRVSRFNLLVPRFRLSRLCLSLMMATVLAISHGATAQISSQASVAPLRHALDLTRSSALFFFQAAKLPDGTSSAENELPTRERIEQHCDKLREAIDTFMRVAPAPAVEETSEQVRVLLIRWARRVPESLQVPFGCEQQRGREWLANMSLFANTLVGRNVGDRRGEREIRPDPGRSSCRRLPWRGRRTTGRLLRANCVAP